MIPLSPQERISLLVFALAVLTICGLEIVVLARSLYRRSRGRSARRILFAPWAIGVHALVVVMFACMLYGYFIEPRWIDVHTVTLQTPLLKSATFRIVQISDLHCGEKPRNEERTVEIVNALKPDIVVATGDFLCCPEGFGLMQRTLSRLEASLGKFAVAGNFDVGHWPQLDIPGDGAFRVLDRETVVVTKGEDSLAITGVGYAPFDAVRKPIEGFSADRFDVFLFHTPDLIEDLSRSGVDLYLCGHTHGGQVALPWYGAVITFSKFGKKYESGMHRVGDTVLYVNRGLGMEPRPAPQIRFLARPEISVFDIRPK
jgi:predicted MPP superfamily phosphohydrolase